LLATKNDDEIDEIVEIDIDEIEYDDPKVSIKIHKKFSDTCI
jgi:hypothetical protein